MRKRDKKATERRAKDQFSMTLVGMLFYSVILIAVVAGSYLGIKSLLKNREAAKVAAASAIEQEETAEEKTVEASEPKSEVVTEETASDADVSEADAGKTEEETKTEAEEVTYEQVTKEESAVSNPLKETTLDVSKAVKKTYIDYDTVVIEPKKRNDKAEWKDTVFSKLENVNNPSKALINSYDFTRKIATCYDDKKLILEIYSNPSSHLAEKITTLEYCGDVIDTIDYYYSNGRINYIAQYQSVINTPIDISSNLVQSRYYFDNDSMIRFVYCEGEKATEYNVKNLKKCSMGTVEQYDYLEKDMLNRAYITYNAAKLLPETVTLEGYVLDEFNCPVEDVDITLINSKNKEVADCETNGDGMYSMEISADDAEVYILSASKESFKDTNVYGVTAYPGSLVNDILPIYLGYRDNETEYEETLLIKDGKNAGSKISGAEVKIREGLLNRKGITCAEGVSDDNGLVKVSLGTGCYTAEVKYDGYITGYYPIYLYENRVAEVCYMVPRLEDDEYVTILSWDQNAVRIGTDDPLDLDLRSFSSLAGFVVKSSAMDDNLREEIIDIKNTGSDTFSYYVSDFLSCVAMDSMSYSLSSSGAQVYVFSGNDMDAVYHVPLAHAGVIWKPFELRNHRLLTVNNYHYVIESESRFSSK